MHENMHESNLIAVKQWQSYCNFIIGKGNIDQVMIIDSKDGCLYASSDEKNFYLKEYNALIANDDGSEVNETVNEADIILEFLKTNIKPRQGLRINGIKHQVLRNFINEENNLVTIYGKILMGGSCIVNSGKCILIGTFSEVKSHTAEKCYEVLRLMGNYLNKAVWPTMPQSSPAIQISQSDDDIKFKSYMDSLMESDNVSSCGIVSKASLKILARRADFDLLTYQTEIPQEDGTDKLESVNELENMIKLMDKSKPAQGLRVAKVKFQILRSFDDENSGCYTVYGKKTLGGICIVTTDSLMLVAIFDETSGHTAAACNEIVSKLAKTLKSL